MSVWKHTSPNVSQGLSFVDAKSTGSNVSPLFPAKDVRTHPPKLKSDDKTNFKGFPLLEAKESSSSVCVRAYLRFEIEGGFL
ncbi:unnamed protein product, partial [Vitis vinifera]